jgi:hypothetical protein
MRENCHRGARCRQLQARLANSTDPDQRDNALLANQIGNPAQVRITSDERREQLRHVVMADARRALHQLRFTVSTHRAQIWAETG